MVLEKHNMRTKNHLINLIGNRNDNTPNFALLIGSGASATSGVKTAHEMIEEWRHRLYKQTKKSVKYDDWLNKQDWYRDEEEYCMLFEKVYDEPSQRRIYIEECVKDAKLCWGYIYLANCISHNYFNAIFTPNFDDLLNEACFLYADVKPIVCAHDSAVIDIRVTPSRPKIIKLHGDYLYDSMKNTVTETQTLEKNMRDKLLQFGREYGLVLIGYGGNDKSIMDILELMVSSEGYFPHGLYWCKRKDDNPSKRLNRLLRREKTYWIEIDGFDEFMAELHKGLGITLPPVVSDPYKATTDRLNSFIATRDGIDHKIIAQDIRKLEAQVQKFQKLLSKEAPEEESNRLVPHSFLGDRQFNKYNYKQALGYYKKALVQDPHDIHVIERMALSYIWTGKFNEALLKSEEYILYQPELYGGYLLKGSALTCLRRAKEAIPWYEKALNRAKHPRERLLVYGSITNNYLVMRDWENVLSTANASLELGRSNAVLINKARALMNVSKSKEAKSIVKGVLLAEKDNYLRACAYAVINDKERMLAELSIAMKEKAAISKINFKTDFDFADYQDDADFRRIIYPT